jgi:hypothetical protein
VSFDNHKNFAYSIVATAPSPATSGTSVTVQTGDGSLFPAAPFNVTIWPAGQQPSATNAEIARCTSRSGDVLTITRTQEGSSARSVVVGDQIALTITAKSATDVEAVAAAAIPQTLFDAKGDLLTATADDTPAKLTAGADGLVLTADSSQAKGLKWAPSSLAGGGGAAAVVATTVAGLGSPVNGMLGRIRAGSTPFDFLAVVYDSTYGKWVSEPQSAKFFNPIGVTTSSSTYANYPTADQEVNIFAMRVFTDAGLTLQMRVMCLGNVVTGPGTGSVSGNMTGYDIGGADSSTLATGVVVATQTSLTRSGFDSGWTDVSPTVKDLMSFGAATKFVGTGNLSTVHVGVHFRWIG